MNDLPPDPPHSAPPALCALWPLVQQFGVADDVQRERLLSQTSPELLIELVDTVTPAVFAEIDAYLDETHDAEESVAFGDLAQAAIEAASLLRRQR